MKKVLAVGLSRVKTEGIGTYLQRLAKETADFETKGWGIKDLLLSFDSTDNPTETTTALIVLDESSVGDANESYLSSMTCETFVSAHYDSPSEALMESISMTEDWLKKNPGIEIYNMKSELVVTEGGKQKCITTLYYSLEE